MERIRLGDVEWWCNEGFEPLLQQLPWHRLRRPRQLPPERVAKDNRHRTVARLDHPQDPDLPGFYVKRHKFARTADQVKHLLAPWRLRREWTLGRRLRAEGVPTPEPVAHGERWRGLLPREAFYVTRELPGAVSFRRRLERGQAVETALDRAARLTAALGNHGLYHLDYHAENILMRPDRAGALPHLMDLHDLRRRRVTAGRMRRMLADLAHSADLPALERGRWPDFVRTVLARWTGAGEPLKDDVRRWCRAVERHIRNKERDRLRRRTHRCVKESTTFTSDTTARFRVYRRRDFPVQAAINAARRHDRALGPRDADGRVLLEGAGGALTVVPSDSVPRVGDHRPCPPGQRTAGPVCVRSVHARNAGERLKDRLRPRSRAVKRWIALQGFAVRGVPAPRPIAVLEARCLRGGDRDYMVMEGFEGAETLETSLEQSSPSRHRREMARQLGGLLSRLHAADVAYPDLSPRNLLVVRGGAGPAVRLLDAERVRFEEPAGRERLEGWLSRLDRSAPSRVTELDRLRCLRACGRGRWSAGEEKAVARRVRRRHGLQEE